MEAWFKAKEALLAQGRQSSDGSGYCQYRGTDGAKCFIGHLIEDDAYNSEFEGEPISNYAVITALEESGWSFSSEELKILDKGRFIHDHTPVQEWEEGFEEWEKVYGLSK